ncbi:LOW QUALITY PROTEIN: hypothetical protein OSB04_un001633 [Centaurea solstitialis]|uniref:Integrase catalytic domain-containing protein n=1 Tax=Centaurea solstitialis TaxID=347529 RepID=A0AA38S406_9ASTR|nr:LOW QUALITY PROTEIN: hypothetical protein OSB04_un001633 [Centaurea solstitialis]
MSYDIEQPAITEFRLQITSMLFLSSAKSSTLLMEVFTSVDRISRLQNRLVLGELDQQSRTNVNVPKKNRRFRKRKNATKPKEHSHNFTPKRNTSHTHSPNVKDTNRGFQNVTDQNMRNGRRVYHELHFNVMNVNILFGYCANAFVNDYFVPNYHRFYNRGYHHTHNKKPNPKPKQKSPLKGKQEHVSKSANPNQKGPIPKWDGHVWYMDSGCSKHMSGRKELLANFKQKYGGNVQFGNKLSAPIMGYGDILHHKITINKVAYVEGLSHNLLSIGKFCDKGLEVNFRETRCCVRTFEGQELIEGTRRSNLYTFNFQKQRPFTEICLLSKASFNQNVLSHRRLSHLNYATINQLAKAGLVTGLPSLKFTKEQLCSACEMGKIKKSSHKLKVEHNTFKPLQLLHMDLRGPMRVQSINGRKYVLVIVDDFSRYTWVNFLRSKDGASDIIISFIRSVQVRLQLPVQVIRTDNGTEIKNRKLDSFLDSVGITHTFSAARTPQQNGVVERKNHTLVEAARTMLAFSKLPLHFWAEAVASACFTQNRSLITKRFMKTPYELVYNRPPSIKFFRVFVKNDKDNLDKFSPKGDEGVFIGYAKDSPSYRVYNKKTRRVVESTNVDFEEGIEEDSTPAPVTPGISGVLASDQLHGNPMTSSSPTNKPTSSNSNTCDLDELFEFFYKDLPAPANVSLPIPAVVQPAPRVMVSTTDISASILQGNSSSSSASAEGEPSHTFQQQAPVVNVPSPQSGASSTMPTTSQQQGIPTPALQVAGPSTSTAQPAPQVAGPSTSPTQPAPQAAGPAHVPTDTTTAPKKFAALEARLKGKGKVTEPVRDPTPPPRSPSPPPRSTAPVSSSDELRDLLMASLLSRSDLSEHEVNLLGYLKRFTDSSLPTSRPEPVTSSSQERLEGKLDALKTEELAEIKGSISDMQTQIRALETSCHASTEPPKRRHDDRDDPDRREGEIHKKARLGSSVLTGTSSGAAPSGTHMGTGADNPTADSAEGQEIVFCVNPEISHPVRVAASDDVPSDDYESCMESYSSDSPLLVPHQSLPHQSLPGMEMYSSNSSSPPMSPHSTYDTPSPRRPPLPLTLSPTYRGPQLRVLPHPPSPVQDDSPSRTPSPPVKAPRRAPNNPPSVSPPKVIYTREKGALSNRRKYVEPLKSVKWDRERRRGSYLEDSHRSIFTNKVENLPLEKYYDITNLPPQKQTRYLYWMDTQAKPKADVFFYDNPIIRISEVSSVCFQSLWFSVFSVIRKRNGEFTFTEADFNNVHIDDIDTLYNDLKTLRTRPQETFKGLEAVKRFIGGTGRTQKLMTFRSESHQSTINLSLPNQDLPNIDRYSLYQVLEKPTLGVVYQNQKEEKKFMRCNEVHKYSDGTLHIINKGLATEKKRLELEVLKTKHWINPSILIDEVFQIIEHRLEHRIILRRFESYCSLRKIEGPVKRVDERPPPPPSRRREGSSKKPKETEGSEKKSSSHQKRRN